ncbi:MAG TPA: ABC transporter permease [Firmicutes bacterium]|jgi:putative ABC transport system permease protein|nr:ABC transporter permease [Bacillota bacterium]
MFLIRLALKNLTRHRNRTLLTSLLIAFAVFFYILMDSLIGGMVEMSYETIIDYETGHLQLATGAYWDKEEELPLENLLELDGWLLPALGNLQGEPAFSPELNFPARLNTGFSDLPVIGKGVDPLQLLKVFKLEGQFLEGKMFASGEYRAVIGKRLADLLKLQTGEYITLLVRDKNETFNTIDLEIAGLVHTVNPNVNNNFVYLPLDLAQQALDVDNQVSKVIIRLADRSLAAEAAGRLQNSLDKADANIAVIPWNQMEALSFEELSHMENQIILAIILLIAAIAIINTVILSALERMGEIGMMKALGLQTREVVYAFVLESTGIGILGGLIGLIFGVVGTGLLVSYGMDWGAMLGGIEMTSFGIPVVGKMYGVWNPGAFLFVFIFAVLVSFLSSILPSYWAASKDPIKAIDHH